MEDALQAAMAFAVQRHVGQYRDGPAVGAGRLPYVSHCFDVLRTAWRCGILDGITGPAAMCHDVLEDCPGTTPADMAAKIGGRATDVVRDLTFHHDPTDARPKQTQKADHLGALVDRSLEAVAIKACDRYCNVSDYLIGEPGYAAEYLQKGASIYVAVESRRVEIDRRWGTGTADRLIGLRDELHQRMAR